MITLLPILLSVIGLVVLLSSRECVYLDGEKFRRAVITGAWDFHPTGDVHTEIPTIGEIGWEDHKIELRLDEDAALHYYNALIWRTSHESIPTYIVGVPEAFKRGDTLIWPAPSPPWKAGDRLIVQRNEDIPLLDWHEFECNWEAGPFGTLTYTGARYAGKRDFGPCTWECLPIFIIPKKRSPDQIQASWYSLCTKDWKQALDDLPPPPGEETP